MDGLSGLIENAFRRVPTLALAAAAVAIAGIATVGVWVLFGGLPVAWLLLAISGAVSGGALAWGLWQGRYFEPLTVLAAAGLVLFVLRPLQLFLRTDDLYSYFPPESSLDDLLYIENQEVARFVVIKMQHPLGPALTRAVAASTLFLTLFVAGYASGWLKQQRGRLAALGRRSPPVNVRAAVAGALALGIAAELVVIGRAGGPADALRGAADQTSLEGSVILNLLTGFVAAGLIVWAAWRKPESRREWLLFGLAVIQLVAFAFAVGSRAQAFLPVLMLVIVVHYRWRPWRLRELALAMLAVLLFASASLAVREGVDSKPLGEALANAPRYAIDGRAVLNDLNAFDFVLYATQTRPYERKYEYGERLLDAFRSYVPAGLDPGKPEGGDITFRKEVWGNDYQAGRPPTIIGDLYIDFGFPGIALGALLLGVVARLLLGLTQDLRGPGGERRVAFYAVSLVVLYEVVTSTYSVALGFAMKFGIPLLVAVYGFGSLHFGTSGERVQQPG
jgi:hypothetical protein